MFDFIAEREPDTYVPYIGHASSGVLLLDNGDLLAMLRLDGVTWETADNRTINALHTAFNVLLRNVASERVLLYSHVVRTRDDGSAYPATPCRSEFARDLDDAYRARVCAGLYRNEVLLSVVLRGPQAAGEKVGRALRPRQRGRVTRQPPARDLDLIEAAVATLQADLGAYGPTRLGVREGKRGVLFTDVGAMLKLILTGEYAEVPLVDGHLGGAIYTDRVICGPRAIEIRTPGRPRFAAAFGMREYPARTWPGMFDVLLSAPYACVLTQSFAFLNKQTASDIMSRKQNQMLVSWDKARSQADALTDASDQLHSNEFVMGTYHLSLAVFADHYKDLAEITPRAARDLAESGAAVTREDMANEAAYWGQLPGNAHLRIRPGAISSRCFAAMAAMHNYPLGPAEGRWGEPLMLLKTEGRTPYRFHLHAATGQVTDLGNIFMVGPAGSGKTTALGLMLALTERQGAQVVFFDKDRGGEILSRQLDGTYLVLPSGEPSGLAPLRALDASPRNLEFLHGLIAPLLVSDGDLPPDLDRRLTQGLAQVMRLPPEHRGMGELRAFLGQRDASGPAARLDRWCKGGALGWVLDNDADHVSLDANFLGFDMTAVLDDPVARGPVMAYLFHRVEALVDGRRLVIAIDEFWKALADAAFRDLINDKLKTIRKLNGVVILATQSPRDALNSPIAHSIIEQCPTQIIFPNDRADRDDYVDGLKLTEAEYLGVRETYGVGTRRFLLKQGSVSLACEIDLTGMDDFVAVLSGRARTVRLAERLIGEFGPDPAAWLPAFKQQWRSA